MFASGISSNAGSASIFAAPEKQSERHREQGESTGFRDCGDLVNPVPIRFDEHAAAGIAGFSAVAFGEGVDAHQRPAGFRPAQRRTAGIAGADDRLEGIAQAAAWQAVLDSCAGAEASRIAEPTRITQPETWKTWPLGAEVLLVFRRPGFRLSPDQIQAIQRILENPEPNPQEP